MDIFKSSELVGNAQPKKYPAGTFSNLPKSTGERVISAILSGRGIAGMEPANPSSPVATPPLAGGATVPVAAAKSPAVEATATNTVDPTRAAVIAKNAAINKTPTKITPNAGITAAMVQRPTGGETLPPLPYGVKQFDFNRKAKDVGIVANNSSSDWSPDSNNVQAIAGGMDKFGRNYDEQVAHARQITNNTMRQLATEMTPQEKAAAASMNNRALGSFMRSSAAGEMEGFKTRRDAFLGKEKNEQALKIAGMDVDAKKYVADQGLTGHQVVANANVKAAQIGADAGVVRAKDAARVKMQEGNQKDYAERVKGLVGDWSKLNLPKEYVPKLNQFAQIHADAENPNGKTFLLAPNREGGMYAALPKQYEAQYNKLLQTMPHNDAAARVMGIAQQNGHVVANVPDFRRFMPTNEAIKQQTNTILTGA